MFASKPPPYRGPPCCVVISGVHNHDPVHISNGTVTRYSYLHEPSRCRSMANCRPVFRRPELRDQEILLFALMLVALTYSVSPLSGQVSKWFCTLTHDSEIWKALYANAPFLRPPAPFTTVSFERTSIQSARLAQSWTRKRLQTVSRASVPFDGHVTNEPHLVGGRWLVVCQCRRRFVLYDTKADAETRAPQVLWEHWKEVIWGMCLGTPKDGQYVVYVLVDHQRWLCQSANAIYS